MNADLYAPMCMCFTELSNELACNYLHLVCVCVCVCVCACASLCACACMHACVHMCVLAAACGQSEVAAVGGTAGQPDNRV